MVLLTPLFILILFGTISVAHANSQGKDESLHDILSQRIYTASRKEENLHSSSSSAFVITAEDLERMNVRHIADALRIVPGLQVAKASSNKWVVASRGFGEQFSNKLLVLVDGRPIYNTLFSGVLWNQQDIPIIDIEQIEVIKGANATLWGANAVNGVINIVTKHSNKSAPLEMRVTSGFTHEGDNSTVIEGQSSHDHGEAGTSRASLKLRKQASYTSTDNNVNYDDSYDSGSVHFRYDTLRSPDHSFNLTAELSNHEASQPYNFPTLSAPFEETINGEENNRSASIRGEWIEALSESNDLTIRGYVDYTDWEYAQVNPEYVNVGIDTQIDYLLFSNWETISGMGYRLTSDQMANSDNLIWSRTSLTAHYWDAFFQTKVPLIEKQLFVTTGSRIESNTYDSFSASPSFKISWDPSPFFMVWSSWSRAYRMPSRNTHDLQTNIAGTPDGYVSIIPSDDFKPEKVDSYELGTRINPIKGVHVDISAFYSEYENLRTFINDGTGTGGNTLVALNISNAGAATTKGIEISSTFQTTPDFKLALGASYHDLDYTLADGVVDNFFLSSGGNWPNFMWNAQTFYRLSDTITLNSSAFFSAEQKALNVSEYFKLDANIAWEVAENAQLVLGVDNLTDSTHTEYSSPLFGQQAEVPQFYYLTVKLGL